MILVCGANNCNQLGEEPNLTTATGDPAIFPPKRLQIDPASILSLSVSKEHCVVIYRDGTMQGIGFNNDYRISNTLPKKLITKFTTFTIDDENGQPLIPISAIAGTFYTLYLFKSTTSPNTNRLCIIHTIKQEGTPLFLNINGHNPESLYGGSYYAASIDSEGSVILINPAYLINHKNDKINSISLPKGEKAINLACVFEKIYALSHTGKIYYSHVKLGIDLSFFIVSELSEFEFLDLSGCIDHVLAVRRDGKVFALGENKFGSLGLGPQEKLSTAMKFTLVESVEEMKISNVFTGGYHTFFRKKEEGKLFACGWNYYGEFCCEGTEIDINIGDFPVETRIEKDGNFVIAGYCFTVIFVGCEIPPNIPNKNICNPQFADERITTENDEESEGENEQIKKKKISKKKKKVERFEKQKELFIIEVDDIEDYKNKVLIGCGSQSRVFRVFKDQYFALKELRFTTTKSENFKIMQNLLKEFQTISMIDHPNIIKTFGMCFGDEKQPPLLLLELCSKNLATSIKDLLDYQIVTTIYEICLGMIEIHKHHFIHRDLKPQNILFDNFMHVKICDFGISRLIEGKSRNDDDDDDDEEEGEDESLTAGIGTIKFMAPELLNEETHYDNKVDVYAFGVVLFFILTNGNYPEISIAEAAMGKKAPIPEKINKFARDLIDRCWSENPKERPSFCQILDDIKNNNFMLIDSMANKDELTKVKSFLNL